MAEFLRTHGTSHRIESVIVGAKVQLVLVSPYLQLSKLFFERLKDAANRGVSIKIIYGKDDLKNSERQSLSQLETLELFYSENLHAKCYFNEGEMVITSMNMYEFSEKNNREMGVFITKKNDLDLYRGAVDETLSIIKSSKLISCTSKQGHQGSIGKKSGSKSRRFENQSQHGRCIRCSDQIPYAVEKPYCRTCYSTWSQFANPEYQESSCHSCGRAWNSTMSRPLCYDCFKRHKDW